MCLDCTKCQVTLQVVFVHVRGVLGCEWGGNRCLVGCNINENVNSTALYEGNALLNAPLTQPALFAAIFPPHNTPLSAPTHIPLYFRRKFFALRASSWSRILKRQLCNGGLRTGRQREFKYQNGVLATVKAGILRDYSALHWQVYGGHSSEGTWQGS